MSKSEGTAGKYQRVMPVTNKNIGKQHPHEKRGGYSGARYYTPSLPYDPSIDSRQVMRRKVIFQRKRLFPVGDGLPRRRVKGPTPPRLVRPKRHRWLKGLLNA